MATNKGGIPLAVKNGRTGFLVRAKSGKVIADVVNKILNNEKLRQELGNNARKLVEERFDWLEIKDRVLKYYQEAAKVGEKLKIKHLPTGIDKEDLEREKRELEKKIDYVP